VPNSRGFVQSGFCEIALHPDAPDPVPRDLTEPSRFTNPFPPIRLLRISILQSLRGDFCNNICTKLPFAAVKTRSAFWGTAVEKCSL
jgi:hypothetical protein